MSGKVVNVAFNKKEKGFKEIKWIPVKSLSIVWQQSQRMLNEKHAQSIADNFDPEMFGTLSVTKPNGRGIYHVIDGHHRKVAVEKLWGGEEMVPCQVFDAEDPARAAMLFDHINTARKNPAPVDIFKVRVTAGHEVEKAVNKIVNACGYVVNHRQSGGSNNIGCVGALCSIYQSYGAEILGETLRLVKDIWGANDQTATGANIIKGVGEFLSEFRDADKSRLKIQIGAKYTPARLNGAAKSYKELHGGTMQSAVKSLMVVTYNEGLRSESKRLSKVRKG